MPSSNIAIALAYIKEWQESVPTDDFDVDAVEQLTDEFHGNMDKLKSLLVQCCERDTDGDGNCDRHPAPEERLSINRQTLINVGINVFALDLMFKTMDRFLSKTLTCDFNAQTTYRGNVWRWSFELVSTEDKDLADAIGVDHVETNQ